MKAWTKHAIAVLTIIALVIYFYYHREQLHAIKRLDLASLFWVLIVVTISTLNKAWVIRHLLQSMDKHTSFYDMLLLQQVTILLNYLPMKAGSLFRANYLKRRYGLTYVGYASLIAVLTVAMTTVAAAMALAAMLLFYGAGQPENWVLIGCFALTFAVGVIFCFVPLPVPQGERFWQRSLRVFLEGRGVLAQNHRVILPTAVMLGLDFVLSAVRLGIIYHCLGISIHPGGYLILGAMGHVLLYLNVTPGGLGIREAILGASAAIMGLTVEEGLMAAMADRAILLGWTLAIGGMGLLWVWKHYPDTLHRAKQPASATALIAEADQP